MQEGPSSSGCGVTTITSNERLHRNKGNVFYQECLEINAAQKVKIYFVVLISEQCKRDKKGVVVFFVRSAASCQMWRCVTEAFSGIPTSTEETHASNDWTQLGIIDTNS